MSVLRPSRRSRQKHTSATALTAMTQQARMVPVQAAAAIPRPSTVVKTYQEDGFDQLAVEQLREHAAAGEEAAAKSSIRAAGLESARTAGDELITINATLIEAARDRLVHLQKHLGPFAKRKAGSRWGYFLCLALLLLGDFAGLAGALISYGEVPILAGAQAVSASVATVIAGQVGKEFKYIKQAQERQSCEHQLSAEQVAYEALLLGPLAGRRYVLAASLVALLIGLFIAVGIGALRMSIEGQTSGFVFGGLAIGIALGSWINSFCYADAVADKIEAARQDFRRETRAHARMTRAWWRPRAERAAAAARLIRGQHRLHGEAAAAQVAAMKFSALQQSPDIVGHGVGVGEIGRKPRLSAQPESNGAVL
ncbi:hypothetical protein APR08_003883 [Nocardia amikacinitolerans]|nr:hypothetical protein [Nocardia amikacinitolerans]